MCKMLAHTTKNTACITDGLYRILFDYAADSMFMLDRQGQVKLVNKRGENILGYNTGDLRGKKLDFIILKPYRNIFNKAYKKRFGREAGERCYSVWDKKLPCKDCIAEKAVKYFKSQRKEEILQTGEVYDTIAIPLKNRDGTVSAIEMITDITESRRLQQQETLINSIIRLADVYDAMTSQRPYRKAISQEEVDKMIKENAGSQFDPQVVKAFFEIEDKILEIKQMYIG